MFLLNAAIIAGTASINSHHHCHDPKGMVATLIVFFALSLPGSMAWVVFRNRSSFSLFSIITLCTIGGIVLLGALITMTEHLLFQNNI